MAGGDTGNEMLGTNMLGGSMLGGGPSGGSGDTSSGILGDWFTGVDMLGGGPGSGEGGGGGGGGLTGYGGRVQGEAAVSGSSLDLLTVHPVEASPSGQASVSGTLGVPHWAGAGTSEGSTAFGELSPILRLGPKATLPFQEAFDPRDDFPQTDGDHWPYDSWFVRREDLKGSGGLVYADVQNGQGRLRARGTRYPEVYAHAVARQEPFGDADIVFDHTSQIAWANSIYFAFRASDHTGWDHDTPSTPRHGYYVEIYYNGDFRLCRRTNGGWRTILHEIDQSVSPHVDGRPERMRIRTVGGRIQIKNWAVGDPEPVDWDIDYQDTPGLIDAGVVGFSVYAHYNSSNDYVSEILLDDLAISRIAAELDGSISTESSLTGEVSLPTFFQPDEAQGDATVEGSLDVHLLPAEPVEGDSEVTGEIWLAHPLNGQASGSSQIAEPSLDTYKYEGSATGEALVEASPEAEYEVAVTSDGVASVSADMTNLIFIDQVTISGTSSVEAAVEVFLLSGGDIDCTTEVGAHLGYIDDIVRMLVDPAAASSTVSSALSATVQLAAQSSGSATFTEALLTYWKPMTPVTIQVASDVVGQFEIYTIPPGPIEGSSELVTNLEGDYQYFADFVCGSVVDLAIPLDVELYFLPGASDGSATVTGDEFTIAPDDLQVDQSEGSTEFVSTGTGYLLLNLNRGLEAVTTTPYTASEHEHPATGTVIDPAILGMPVVIGRYQAYFAAGSSSLVGNLFINEGGQANCNSRVSAFVSTLQEVFIRAVTNGNMVRYDQMDFPAYYTIDPDFDYVVDAPCGTRFMWVDLWPRGLLEPLPSNGWAGVGQFDENGRNVHPYAFSDSKRTGIYSGWNRDEGYFVSNMGMNLLGLFARTSESDDHYNLNRYDEPGYEEFEDQVWQEIRQGQLWHEPIEATDRPHGYCGTKFVSTVDGTNTVDLFVELKNALYARPVGIAEVVGNFIILKFRTITVAGNVAREADRTRLVEGGTARSPDYRMPVTLRTGAARDLSPVRSGRVLYT